MNTAQSLILFLALLLSNSVLSAGSEKGFTELAIDTDGFTLEQLVKDPDGNDGEKGRVDQPDSDSAPPSSQWLSLQVSKARSESSFHPFQAQNPGRHAHGIRAPPHILTFI